MLFALLSKIKTKKLLTWGFNVNSNNDNPEGDKGKYMKKLYVSNLSFNANESDLASVFEQFGKISEIKVVFDRATNRSRGFGFVTFENAEDADNATHELNETEFMGRTLKVAEAVERPRTPNNNTRHNGRHHLLNR